MSALDLALATACWNGDFKTAKILIDTTDVNPFAIIQGKKISEQAPNGPLTAVSICAEKSGQPYDDILELIITGRRAWIIDNIKSIRSQIKVTLDYCIKYDKKENAHLLNDIVFEYLWELPMNS